MLWLAAWLRAASPWPDGWLPLAWRRQHVVQSKPHVADDHWCVVGSASLPIKLPNQISLLQHNGAKVSSEAKSNEPGLVVSCPTVINSTLHETSTVRKTTSLGQRLPACFTRSETHANHLVKELVNLKKPTSIGSVACPQAAGFGPRLLDLGGQVTISPEKGGLDSIPVRVKLRFIEKRTKSDERFDC